MGNWIDGLTERGILECTFGKDFEVIAESPSVWCEIGYVDPEFERSLN